MTEEFEKWLRHLGRKDGRAHAKVLVRLDRAGKGNFGDCEPVGAGVSEMRIDYGPGYRVYFLQCGETIYLILMGGDKSTQARDIAKAHAIAGLWTNKKGCQGGC